MTIDVMSTTEQYDAKLSAAEQECERLRQMQRAAHEHCERVRAHRIRTIGASRDQAVEPAPDLGELRRQSVEAQHALQDVQLARRGAEQRLQALLNGRPGVEAAETRAHLVAVLALEEADAAAVDAAAQVLVAAARSFLTTAIERANLSRALGVTEPWAAKPAAVLVDRVRYLLKTVAAREFTAEVQPAPPLLESHQALTKAARGQIAAAQLRGELPAPAAVSSS